MSSETSIKTKTAVAIAGSADSGKSSFISVMVYKILDNGNGSARELVAKHQHEINKGKTSDISTRTLDIPEKNQALTLIDLCGQADYFKTTTFGLSGYFPDYSFLIISANNGITPMTTQHMRVLFSLNIPIIIIVTKIDIPPQNKYKETIDNIKKLIIGMCGKTTKIDIMNNPFENSNNLKLDETDELKNNIKTKAISYVSEFQERQLYYPVISMSNKTGYLVDLVRDIMKELPSRDIWRNNSFIVNVFKKAVIEHLNENFMKNTIDKVIEFIEILNFTKQIISKIIEKNKHTDPNYQSFVSNIFSNILPSWVTGKMTEEEFIKSTLENCQKLTVYQKNECKNLINHINQNIKQNSNYDYNTNIDICVKNKISESFMLDFPKNIITSSAKIIIENLKNQNKFDFLINDLFEILCNEDNYNNIKNMENKASCEKIKNIFSQLELNKFYSTEEFEKIIFVKNQELKGNVYYIDNCYNPPGIGLVITGINRGSDINLGSKLLIGPINKDFVEFKVKSMHNNNKEIIDKLENHGRGTLAMALTKKGEIKRNQIKKGMVVISNPIMSKNVCFRFKAVIKIAAKSVTIKNGYTPVLHIGTIRQPARIILDPAENNGKEVVGFDGKSNIAIVTFKFKCYPEYVEPYTVFLIRNGDIHGIGVILSITPMCQDIDAEPDNHKIKYQK